MTSKLSEVNILLCPNGLTVEQVQVLVRHGERAPIWHRFQNTGLTPYWPYCSAAQRFIHAVIDNPDGSGWDSVAWKRRLEISGPAGRPIPAQGPRGETSNICMPGELTDRGRETCFAFGKLLRRRYIDQLNFLPNHLSDASLIYIRTTEVTRVIESMQQILYSLYPPDTNKTSAPWDIAIRSSADETLLPNTKSCARLAELSREFSRTAAKKWNGSTEMDYLSEKLGNWMPHNKALALDSRPRLSAVMDSINATAAHGPDTRLPEEFYDEKVRKLIDHIVVDEIFHPYSASREFRMLGVGQLVGDMTLKMIDQVDWNRKVGVQSKAPPRLSLLGCHDRTIGAVLASLGCLERDEKWPAFTSHIAFELFRKKQTSSLTSNDGCAAELKSISGLGVVEQNRDTDEPRAIGRRLIRKLKTEEVHKLDEYFVRIRYNDRIIIVPGCRGEGKHFDKDQSICTLSAFKSIVDNFTPRNWKLACSSNIGAPLNTEGDELAGY